MLETLDTIPWETLEAAFIPATQIPSLLKDLASSDATVREQAAEILEHAICNQGFIYEVTAPVIPFLLELLSAQKVQDKEALLYILIHIAREVRYKQATFQGPTQRAIQLDQSQQREWMWIEQTQAALTNGYSVYLGLLTDQSAFIRSSAAYVLSFCSPHMYSIVPLLHKYLSSETDRVVQASLILCLGDLYPAGPDALAFFNQQLYRQESHLLKVAAAMSLAHLAGKHLPQEALDELVFICDHPALVQADFGHLYWTTSGVEATLSQTFRSIGLSITLQVLPSLIRAMKRIDDFAFIFFTPNLLYFTFEGKPVDPETTVDQLTQVQREVLTTLATCNAAWTYGNTSSYLARFGIPGRREQLREFLRLPPDL